jgi:hypothetical protein
VGGGGSDEADALYFAILLRAHRGAIVDHDARQFAGKPADVLAGEVGEFDLARVCPQW